MTNEQDRSGVYIRVCHENERMIDLLAEAKAHCCVLAYRDGVAMIMPELVDGWTPCVNITEEDEIERLRRLN